MLPLRIDRPHGDISTEALEQLNKPVIELLEMLDSGHTTKPDHKDTGELQRLEAKLDILIRMVARVIQNPAANLQVSMNRLEHSGLEWQGSTELREGEKVVVGIFFHPLCPEPVTFPATVSNLHDNGGWLQFGSGTNQLPVIQNYHWGISVLRFLVRIEVMPSPRQRFPSRHRGRTVRMTHGPPGERPRC